jgi:hypothetical protein
MDQGGETCSPKGSIGAHFTVTPVILSRAVTAAGVHLGVSFTTIGATGEERAKTM